MARPPYTPKPKAGPVFKPRRTYTGRFLPCPASGVTHPEVIGCEVMVGPKGAPFFVCPSCTCRCFLNTWEDGWGYMLAEIEARGARCPAIPVHRREELLGGRS